MPKVRVKGVRCMIHPDFYLKMEQERLKFQKKGVKLSQLDLTKRLAMRLDARQGVLGYAKAKAKKFKKK